MRKKYEIDSELTKLARQKAPSNIYLYPIVDMAMKLFTYGYLIMLIR